MMAVGIIGGHDVTKDGNYTANVTSEDGRRLARRLASQSMVLLKNDGGTLPVEPTDNIEWKYFGCDDKTMNDPAKNGALRHRKD